MASIKTDLRVRNDSIISDLSRGKDQTLLQKRWELSVEEFQKGWLSEPVPVTNDDRNHMALSPRFCLSEHHGLQQPKFRLIDDLSKSLVNKTVQSTETYCPQDLDLFAALSRLQVSYGAGQLRAWSLDFPHAYKTIALHPGSADAAFICFINPNDNLPYMSQVLVQPFGSRRAPPQIGAAL